MSLRWRIASVLAASALAVGTAAATAAFLGTEDQLHTGIDDALRRSAAIVAGDPHGHRLEHRTTLDARELGSTRPGELCPVAGSFQPASGAQFVSREGTVTACIQGGPVIPTSTRERRLRSGETILRTVRIGDGTYRLLSTGSTPLGTLQIVRNLSEAEAVLTRLRRRLAAIVASATIVAATAGWAIATRLVRPISNLGDATRRIATTGDLTTPIEVRTGGEVGDLAVSFATMVDALRGSREQQRRLVADASHEMRTPLTSLRSNLQLIDNIERLPESERRDVVADVVADVDELSALLERLVELASDLATAESQEPVQLGDLARIVAGRAMRRHDRHIDIDDHGRLNVVARPRQIETAIANLVDNAIKYSPSDAPVSIDINEATVTVLDRGRGLPSGAEEHIFERFYRALEVRSEPGSGLGLSIVEEIIRSHGGQVFARSRPGGGSEVGFTLPTP